MPSSPDDLTSSARLSAATAVVGVIGDPLSHSLSPLLHNTAFAEMGLDWVSVGFPVRSGDSADALSGARALGVRGLSVTMPHKEAVVALVDRRSTLADRLGAVNCVVFGTESFGDNTDGPGFLAALHRHDHFDPSGRQCLVVGGGGAARAVIAALADAGAAEVVVVNRSPDRASSAAALAGSVGKVGIPADAAHCDLVVNATPVGMDPSDQGPTAWPIDPGVLTRAHLVVDLVYHPLLTPWLAAAQARGAAVSNGLGMLVHQAALQLTAWTGLEPPVEIMWQAVQGAARRE